MTAAVENTATIDARLRVVEKVTALFRLERLVYVGFGIAGFVMLLVCLGVMLFRREASEAILGAFGSSGVIAFTGARMLVMWNRALSVVLTVEYQSRSDK